MAFHEATVVQERNDHDLMRDFADEVDGYLKNELIVKLLEGLPLEKSPGSIPDSLRRCYMALTDEGLIGSGELELVDAWIQDIADLV